MSALTDRLFEKALAALKIRDFETASQLCVEVIKFEPEFYEAWIMRGNILQAQDRSFDSILHYDAALRIKDDLRDAWHDRGIAFCNLGMWKAAEDSFNRSLAVMPTLETHTGIAGMWCNLMELDKACHHYREALKIGDDPKVRFNLGVTLLGMGEWEEGYKEYEYRWQCAAFLPRGYALYPKWQGEPLLGKTILLYTEQGYGDEIMSLRFADKKLLGAKKVILQVREPLLRLAETVPFHIDQILPAHAAPPSGIDVSSPLLDVPMCMKMRPFDIPVHDEYLRAPDRLRVDAWKKRLPEGRNVGICWQSGGHLETAKSAQAQKSLPPFFLKHFMIAGVNLISLQKPKIDDAPTEIIDFMDECDDFSDTAALIEALDLTITVDTAVAHLAGALGKPVWNFVRYSGYWPWLGPEVTIGGPTGHCLWYPFNMKLFRQPRLNDWATPVQQAKIRLMQSQ